MTISDVPTMPLPAAPEAVAHIERTGERVVLCRDGKPVAALVSLDDLNALAELDEAEDAYLARIGEERRREWIAEGRPRGVSHEELLARYGISSDSE